MAKGAIAKQAVIEKIASVFGSDYVGEYEKKVYVWSEENGERVQVALSLTCPKTPIGADAAQAIPKKVSTGSNELNFEDMAPTSNFKPAEVTDEERQNIEDLMVSLGL